MSPTSTVDRSPAPTFVQVPPGMTPEQFEALQGSLATLAIVTAVTFGILVWDYFILLPDEIKMYQTSNAKLWHTPSPWAFIILRYAGLVATFTSLFFTSIQSNHCQAATVISQTGVVLVVASSGIIFSSRLFAIWSGDKTIRAIVSVTYLGMIVCWVAVASQYRAKNGPPALFGTNCQIEPIPPWSAISFASTVVFDVLILILTIWKLNTARAASSRVGYLIYRDSLMYFCLTTVTNITILIIEAQGPSANLIKATSLPFPTLITATMGARVFLNLTLFHKRETRMRQGLPFASSASSSGGQNLNTPSLSRPPEPSTTQDSIIVISPDGASPKIEPRFSGRSWNRGTSLEMDDLVQHPAVVRH